MRRKKQWSCTSRTELSYGCTRKRLQREDRMVLWLARNDDKPRFAKALKLGDLWQNQMTGDTGNPEKIAGSVK